MASSVLPKGLFLDSTIKVMEGELDEECDYNREAKCGIRMKRLIEGNERSAFDVPRVVGELSGGMVLTTEMMGGEPFTKAIEYSQDVKDKVSFRELNSSRGRNRN